MSTPVSWRRYNIFLSSTFKDMDFERDVIKFRVIPALNRRFRDRRVELQAIDLRLGVNTSDMTEEESERKVLSVCTSCIDSARPFFIGLIGQRYGWIPPVERWKEFMAGLSEEDRQILSDTAGCSVTEMEIVYGALSQGSFDSSHVLFYLRDDASYEGIPEDLKPVFQDSDEGNLRKLKALKKKVRALFGERGGQDDRCTPYHLDWADGHFCSDEFEAIVTEQLAHQIELETAREDESGAATWWAQEKELEESTLLRLLPGSIELDLGIDTTGLDLDDDEAVQAAIDDDSPDRAVWFVQGFGASTYMAQEYAQRDGDDEVVRLLAVFGLSEYSTSMRPVLARWIHELALVCGEDALPDDEQLLGKMPPSELNELLASMTKKVRDEDKYIEIYLDDVEALETTAPSDLYMPWLDRIADDVSILVNLEDGSEAREKFLKAHPGLSRKMVPVVQDEEDAEGFISQYEKTYFLELPVQVREEMKASVDSEGNAFSPLKVHSIFRIFESLTQEDFAQIRSRDGSQIDAINGYLLDIWGKMPDTPYDIMTFMVNTIAKNLGIGEKMRSAIWTIAAAPSGLREGDIAHFAGEDWDNVQFYRAMNFLYDFFYEDRGRHIWRAKYITTFEDGLQTRQKEISEYILTLDKEDSLRETMGLYYALASCDPSHFAPYMVEGDYLHGQQMAYLTTTYGPQMRQLHREGFFMSDDFEKYCKALPVEQRLQLFMDVLTALADLKEEREVIHSRVSGWLEDVQVDSLSGVDAFTFCSVISAQKDSEEMLEKALAAARRCEQLGFQTSKQLVSMATTLLIMLYRKNGKKEKADALLAGETGETQSAKERFTALFPLLAKAGSTNSLPEHNALLRRFFKEYYDIVNDLELNNETFEARFKSSNLIMNACALLQKNNQHEWLIIALMDFIPSMRLFCRAGNFFSRSEPLELFVQFHMMLGMACYYWLEEKGLRKDWGEEDLHPIQKMQAFAAIATAEGAELLKDTDPDNSLIGKLRTQLAGLIENTGRFRDDYFDEDFKIKDIDKKIKELYDEFLETVD